MTPFVMIQNIGTLQEDDGPVSTCDFGLGVLQAQAGQALRLLPVTPGQLPPQGALWQQQGAVLVNGLDTTLALAVGATGNLALAPLNPADPAQQWAVSAQTSNNSNPLGSPTTGSAIQSQDLDVVAGTGAAFLTLSQAAAFLAPSVQLGLPVGTDSFPYTSVWTLPAAGGDGMPQIIVANRSSEPGYIFYTLERGVTAANSPLPLPVGNVAVLVPQWQGGLRLSASVFDNPAGTGTPMAVFDAVQVDAPGPAGILKGRSAPRGWAGPCRSRSATRASRARRRCCAPPCRAASPRQHPHVFREAPHERHLQESAAR